MAAPYLDQKTIDRIISDALNNGPNPAPSTYLNLTSVPKTVTTAGTTSSSSSSSVSSSNTKPSSVTSSGNTSSNSSHKSSSTSIQHKPKKQWQKQCSQQENNQPTTKIESTIGESNSMAQRNINTSIPVKKESPMSHPSHGKANASMSTSTSSGNSSPDEMPLDLSTPKVTNNN